MAGLKVFVSSTCYDLSSVRAQIRSFLQALGHEPQMSDFSDLLYDPRQHTHSSCVDEVAGCDVLILLVGSRFGGTSYPEALSKIDFDKLLDESKSNELLKTKETLSVTQLEVLKAILEDIPVFTFVEDRVWSDHLLYEKNKSKADIIKMIDFPSIQKQDTAPYIFEFINFLRHRARNNSIHTFSKIQDIEDALRRQWSALFQRLLNESRRRKEEVRRFDVLTDQFEDLRAAILSTIGTANEREVARGVVRFRQLFDFFRGIGLQNCDLVLNERHTWTKFLELAGVRDIVDSSMLPYPFPRRRLMGMRPRCYILMDRPYYYETRYPAETIQGFSIDFEAFVGLSPENRKTIVEALNEMRPSMFGYKRIDEPFELVFERSFLEAQQLESPDDNEES